MSQLNYIQHSCKITFISMDSQIELKTVCITPSWPLLKNTTYLGVNCFFMGISFKITFFSKTSFKTDHHSVKQFGDQAHQFILIVLLYKGHLKTMLFLYVCECVIIF